MTPIQLAEKIMEVLEGAKHHTRRSALEIAKQLNDHHITEYYEAEREAYKREQEDIAQGIK